jgi:hypothetical protein
MYSQAKWVHCHHGMARPRVADRGDGLQIWRVAENILNMQSRRADSGWSSSLGFGRGTNNPPPYETLRTASKQGPMAGCCGCGDEPSGSCATELVKNTSTYSVLGSAPELTLCVCILNCCKDSVITFQPTVINCVCKSDILYVSYNVHIQRMFHLTTTRTYTTLQ